MPNRLADETSPYLLQHQHNPVEWYGWGEEALGRAASEQRPIFLSIGYSACHWCHVMEHESFENEAIAALLNERFICIKVDREERPDLDQVYMSAVQAMTGRGGWPMSVFLTPDLRPFFGGTYWPPSDRGGMPGFDRVILAVDDAWQQRRDECLSTAAQLTEAVRQESIPSREAAPTADLLDAAGRQLERAFDPRFGGFGPAPKFPHAMDLGVLVRLWTRDQRPAWLDMVRLTLDRMAAGGIYDHLGGGFARYSVDARWLVPHFEKMLYDNALLAGAYLEGYLATGDQQYRRVVTQTLDYVLRDMTGAEGGFFSAEDADSLPHGAMAEAPAADADGSPGHAEEGLFYTWTPEEVAAVLGTERGERFCRVYEVTQEGNFEGRSILNLPKSIAQQAALLEVDEAELAGELAAMRAELLVARDARPRPGLDDKVIVAWNGLMIDALARAGAALDEPRYTQAATRAAEFLWSAARDGDRLLHTWRGGRAKLAAYLDDYAALANACVSLYEATFEEVWIDRAASLIDQVLDRFADPAGGGFFYTASDHETLIARNKDLMDNATPGGNSLAATALLRLGRLLGETRYLEAADQTLGACCGVMERAPSAAGQALQALDLQVGPTVELVFVGGPSELAAAAHKKLSPRKVVAWRADAEQGGAARLDGLFAGRASDGEPALYVCEQGACQAPIVGEAAIRAWLEKS
ncbi:Glycosyl hydrolase family 76 [Pirellulimonas nuda]|uniref:Glycosyl hydrolase family 76 n=1 Tax=Pirellulimonas nuda TaxID=2528009 RepID=A0A518DJK6_9BACT|nr:thioredoxin domain-containing protein [Pirellulimonas nuda]QDU91657.1 Glycosyl hydrolase family 76 [Pirellulimonas nuda]